MNRQIFVREHPHLFPLNKTDPEGLQRYLATRGLLSPGETLLDVSKAGEGNMNCTLRATTTRQRLIVTQARPWVEKYDYIAAPETVRWSKRRSIAPLRGVPFSPSRCPN